MHEYGVAENILAFVGSEAAKVRASKVRELTVDVGELTLVDSRILSHALRFSMKGSIFQGCRVHIHKETSSFACRKCGAKWPMKEAMGQLEGTPDRLLVREPEGKEVPVHFLPGLYPTFLHCPKCASVNVDVVGGAGVRVRKWTYE